METESSNLVIGNQRQMRLWNLASLNECEPIGFNLAVLHER